MRNKTLKELLESPVIREIAPDAISKWDLSKEEFYNWTLQDIADKMGWLYKRYRRVLHQLGL